MIALLIGAAAPPLLRAAESGNAPAWLDEVQQPPEISSVQLPKLSPLLAEDGGAPITTLAAWQRRRAKLRLWWLDFLKALQTDAKNPPTIRVIDEDRRDGAIRQRVSYEAEPDERTEAYLLKPLTANGRRPGIVVFHSTIPHSIRQPAGLGPPDYTEEKFGLALARRGYVALCPRNYLWVENDEMSTQEPVVRFQSRHRGSKGMAKMLHDGVVALNILASMSEVDPARLGTVGHSLGGKEVLYLAALDERVRAAVSCEPGIGMDFSNWNDPWYLGQDMHRQVGRHEHHELLALVAPRAFLLVAGGTAKAADGARSWPFIEAAMRVYKLYGGRPRLGMLNHGQGHRVPPEAEQHMYQWLDAYC